ncbi:selenocysteine insertion sequence-binding protein 2 [Anopheles ziemanni]|uniref:selenocysteine insertion sequence-binding protein 2 n=1 Tax=Anopheles coustani TaxID=139045 RepID=UPI00265A1E8D|nr:selenocysteine insertion sequence-binding protein 2 [Anopheles coustani]XP_058172028.1 selenocysteine insertion sequence-binding protein 2 [Anopheles ziemanni]
MNFHPAAPAFNNGSQPGAASMATNNLPQNANQTSHQNAPPLSDGEKLTARKARKEAERQKKQAKKYEEQLKKIRGPKSQKLQIIDESFLEKYQHVQSLPPGPTLKTKKRSKKAPTDIVQINLSECIREQLAGAGDRTETKSIMPIVPIVPQQPLLLHKGKQREVPKEKKLTRLKKDIIKSRTEKTAASEQNERGAERKVTSEGTKSAPVHVDSVTEPKKDTGPVKTHSFDAAAQQNMVDSPFLKAIERCCINDGPPPSRDSIEYQNGFPALKTPASVAQKTTSLRHSRNFRPYCDHFITDSLRELTEEMIVKVFQFQSKAYAKNPIKAVSNKRFVVGFNEVLKYLELRKVRLVLIAPDLEPNDTIDQMVNNVKTLCRQSQVPYLFALKRRKIGFHLLKKAPISCVGMLSYAGCEDTVKQILDVVEQERINYRNFIATSGSI